MIQWKKDFEAPIPDYWEPTGRFRIYQASRYRLWPLQDRESATHPEPIYYGDTLAEAKHRAEEINKEKTCRE